MNPRIPAIPLDLATSETPRAKLRLLKSLAQSNAVFDVGEQLSIPQCLTRGAPDRTFARSKAFDFCLLYTSDAADE